jgi:hypothetical protein
VRVVHLLAQPPDLPVEFGRIAGLAGVVHPSLSPAVPATARARRPWRCGSPLTR